MGNAPKYEFFSRHEIMKQMARQLLKQFREVSDGTPSGVCRLITRQIFREWYAYGLRRDLAVPLETPVARIPLAIRPLQDRDISYLFSDSSDRLTRRSRLEIQQRMAFLAERVPTPYVAIDMNCDRPCFLQWLIGAKSNSQIQSYFCGRFPLLASDEALLEYAYTPSAYRGNGIMPSAMAMIAERAQEIGGRSVITFVLRENTAALKGCAKAGFTPYIVRRDRHCLFHLLRHRRFSVIESASARQPKEVELRELVIAQ